LAVQTVVEASDVFAAGIAVAGVFDWENYGGKYSPYHQLRFGSPDDCPNRIRERSPVNNIDKLKKPILLFHGTGDFNVPIGSSETLVNILLKKKKDFDYVVYPGEPHVWTKPEVWRDFIRRTELFLDGLRKRQ